MEEFSTEEIKMAIESIHRCPSTPENSVTTVLRSQMENLSKLIDECLENIADELMNIVQTNIIDVSELCIQDYIQSTKNIFV